MLDYVPLTQRQARELVRQFCGAFQYVPLPGGGYDLNINIRVDKQGRKKVKVNVRVPQPDLAVEVRDFPEAVDGLELDRLPFMRDRAPV